MKDVTPDYLKIDEGQKSFDDNALLQLKNYVEQYKKLNKDINEKSEELENTKNDFKTLTEETIPEFLSQYGLSDIKLNTGEKIKVKEDLSVSVSEEKRNMFFDFLEKRKEEDIIKTQFLFDRMDSEKLIQLIIYLNEYEYSYELKKNVHPQTLKKYFKELLGLTVDEEDRKKGIEDKRYLRKEDIQNFASVFQLRKTTIE